MMLEMYPINSQLVLVSCGFYFHGVLPTKQRGVFSVCVCVVSDAVPMKFLQKGIIDCSESPRDSQVRALSQTRLGLLFISPHLAA